MPVESSMTDRLAKLHSSAVHDVLKQLGMDNFVLPANIRPLDTSIILAGPVFTVEGEITADLSAHETLIEWTSFLSAVPAEHVTVCQPHNEEIALMGELSAETLQKRNVLGYIVDGGCRDVATIKKLHFPVFHTFFSPKDVVGRWVPTKLGEPITIGDCSIKTGDFILADIDGIVVIPEKKAEEVVTRSETVLRTENLVRKAILDGMDPQKAYLEYGKF